MELLQIVHIYYKFSDTEDNLMITCTHVHRSGKNWLIKIVYIYKMIVHFQLLLPKVDLD